MRNGKRWINRAASLLILAALWGCATSQVQRRVTLRYEGPKPSTLLDPSVQAFPEIAVAPFVDLRKEKNSYGTYIWGNLVVNYTSGQESISAGFTRLVREFLSKAGMKPIRGKWDGRIDTLEDVGAEHAIYGEIERLDFSGRGRFYESKNRGIIRVIIKWGSRSRWGNRRAQKIITRMVEITPDLREYHLFSSGFNHVGQMESLIRKSVNKAIRESMTALFNSPLGGGN